VTQAKANVATPRSSNGAAGPLREGLAVVVCTSKRAASLRRFLDSLAGHDRKPEQFLIVDASPDDETERMVRGYEGFEALADEVQYVHVAEPHVGLTRQRNFAAQRVETDLVAFFDDDVVLLPGCLRELEGVYRSRGAQVVGVGARIRNDPPPRVTSRWRLRLLLRVIPRIRPGVYERSGVRISWRFLTSRTGVFEGDFLSGCAMMWQTRVVRELRFAEEFEGYGLGEDLDFSLRARRKGTILVATSALVDHMRDPAGRTDPYSLGYMEIYNLYQVHRRALPDRTWVDVARFAHAKTVDTLPTVFHLLIPGRAGMAVRVIAGRLHGAWDVLWRR
jgi:GT2 family glycosyltransferase